MAPGPFAHLLAKLATVHVSSGQAVGEWRARCLSGLLHLMEGHVQQHVPTAVNVKNDYRRHRSYGQILHSSCGQFQEPSRHAVGRPESGPKLRVTRRYEEGYGRSLLESGHCKLTCSLCDGRVDFSWRHIKTRPFESIGRARRTSSSEEFKSHSSPPLQRPVRTQRLGPTHGM